MIAALLLAFGTGIVSAQILNFRTIFRVGGAIAVADRLGPQIDRTLTTVTGQRHLAGQDSATKIVPVLSVGDRQAVEIVQVSGSRDAVARTLWCKSQPVCQLSEVRKHAC